MKISMALAVVASIAIGTIIHADTHYVSHTGSNSSPYTSWATATDSILFAVLAADSGDTIQIGSGTFTSGQLILKPHQVIRGLDSDSTHILHSGNGVDQITMDDGCIVEHLRISGLVDTSFGAYFYHLNTAIRATQDKSGVIQNVNITDCLHGIQVSRTDDFDSSKRVFISNNRFSDFDEGIFVLTGHAIIRGNSFFMTNESASGPICQLSGPVDIRNNLIVAYENVSGGPMMDLNACSEIVIENNICLYPVSSSQPSVFVNRGFSGFNTTGRIQNNLFRGSGGAVISFGGDIAIRNNITLDTRLIALLYDSSMTTPGSVGYNLYWKNVHQDTANEMAFLPDPGNIFADPMFADTIEYLLQAFSLAIDAGDPSILDVDGSRSDIGPSGGPGGKAAYVYQDLPPKVPEGFDHTIDVFAIPPELNLTWRANNEADLSGYELEVRKRYFLDIDTIFLIDLSANDTSLSYTDSVLFYEGAFHEFRIRAKDNQQNRSDWHGTPIVIAGASTGDDSFLLPQGFRLHPNYPNPFNASTQITYTLPAPSAVTLTIYDVMGRHVNSLVSATQSAGAYSTTWNGTDDQGHAVGSGVYFYRLTVGDEVTARKMMLLK